MPLFGVVRHEFCEQCSRQDSFKRFSVSNDTQYGSAGVDLCLSDTGDESMEGTVNEAIRDSTEVLVSDDNTASVRKVLCVRVVTCQYMEGSCIVRAHRLSALMLLIMPKT